MTVKFKQFFARLLGDQKLWRTNNFILQNFVLFPFLSFFFCLFLPSFFLFVSFFLSSFLIVCSLIFQMIDDEIRLSWIKFKFCWPFAQIGFKIKIQVWAFYYWNKFTIMMVIWVYVQVPNLKCWKLLLVLKC